MITLYAKIQQFFFGKPEENNVEKFRKWIRLSLAEIDGTSPDCSENTLLNCLQAKGIPRKTGKLIIKNLSGAFCKRLMDQIKDLPNDPSFQIQYMEELVNEKLSKEKRKIVAEEIEQYCLKHPESNLIANLASRNLEYSVIRRLQK